MTEILTLLRASSCARFRCSYQRYTSRFPKPGESVEATKSIEGYGGCSANQCYMAQLLGANTALVGKLGNDEFGLKFKSQLTVQGIHHDHVTMVPDAQTSLGIMLVSETGENFGVQVMGALNHFTLEDAIKAADDLFVPDSGQILVCTYECHRQPLMELLTRAKQKNIITLVNMIPCPDKPWEEIYPYVDFMVMNETEAERASSLAVTSVVEAEAAARVVTSKGVRTAIVTLGKNGAVAFGGSENPSAIHVSAPQVKAVDTAGAGDAFLGAFSFYLRYYPELSMEEKLRRSCGMAATTVQYEGTQSSYPSIENIPDNLLRHG